MKKTNNISVILPVHELDEITKPMFHNAVKSVELQNVVPDELVIVVPKNSEVSEYVKGYDFGAVKDSITVVENDGETDFASQVNLGISKSKSEWVSLLELDDEYANIWFKNVIEYREAHDNVGIFMPIIIDTDNQGSCYQMYKELKLKANHNNH